ncbi:hypothetical protein FKM82_023291 [Ascaphus truei]|uniref:peroxynitrite isomerase THAP4 isoform X1 n=1 Tax=Ascaphus truei TaxID=8439 RepID=UPI003F5A9518
MVICCAATNCTNRQGKGKRGAVSFHRFPLKDPSRLSFWTAALQRNNWAPGPYSFLCSDHFSPESFVPRMPDQHPLLKPNAVPSLFKGIRNRDAGQRGSGVGRKKQVPTRPSPSIPGDISPVSSGEEVLTESKYQPSIVINEDFKDTGCLLISGVSSTSPRACKFISSLHSYSTSSRMSRAPLSQRGATANLLPHVVDMRRIEHACDLPSHAEAIEDLPSYIEVSGVFPAPVEASGDLPGHVEVSGVNSSQIESMGQLPYHIEVIQHPTTSLHCDNYESSPGETAEHSLLSAGKVTFCSQEGNDASLHQPIISLHSYCSQSRPQPDRRHQLKSVWTSEMRATEQSRDSFPTAQHLPPLHPAVAPLAWMLGSWVSDPAGEGEFPTIPPFRYMEEAVITHVGQAMLNFMFCATNPETGKALHRECGFIRAKPGTNHVAFICSQNTGVVEVEEGEVQGEQLSLTSHSVSRISFANEPHVQQISRNFRLTPEGRLEQTVSMATKTQPLAPHLRVTYKKMS